MCTLIYVCCWWAYSTRTFVLELWFEIELRFYFFVCSSEVSFHVWLFSFVTFFLLFGVIPLIRALYCCCLRLAVCLIFPLVLFPRRCSPLSLSRFFRHLCFVVWSHLCSWCSLVYFPSLVVHFASVVFFFEGCELFRSCFFFFCFGLDSLFFLFLCVLCFIFWHRLLFLSCYISSCWCQDLYSVCPVRFFVFNLTLVGLVTYSRFLLRCRRFVFLPLLAMVPFLNPVFVTLRASLLLALFAVSVLFLFWSRFCVLIVLFVLGFLESHRCPVFGYIYLISRVSALPFDCSERSCRIS